MVAPAKRKAAGLLGPGGHVALESGSTWPPAKRGKGLGKASGKGQHEGRSGGSRGTVPHWDKGVPQTQYVFKALGPDALAAALLGERGTEKDKIQRETGVKLVLSNRGDWFPQTSYRVLGAYADDSDCIISALEAMVQRLKDLGDEELRSPPPAGPEFLGKEPGEYVFRFCVTKRMTSHIIGAGGATISRIRQETGAKVFIENDTHLGHRLGRVIGAPDQIVAALRQINDFVQGDRLDASFIAYHGLVNFGDKDEAKLEALLQEVGLGREGPPSGGWQPEKPRQQPLRREPPPQRGGPHRDRWASGTAAASGLTPRLRPKSAQAGPPPGEGGPRAAAPEVPGGAGPPSGPEAADGELGRLAQEIGRFPPGTAEADFTMEVVVPAAEVELLLADPAPEDQEGGVTTYLEYVQEETRTLITVQEDDDAGTDGGVRRLAIVGTLPSMYVAHAMLMRRCQELTAQQRKLQQEEEARAAEGEEAGGDEDEDVDGELDPEALKAQIAALQEQLTLVKAREKKPGQE